MTNQTTTEHMALTFTNHQTDRFRRLALAVAPAASTDPARETINAVLVEVQDDEIRMTATDSYLMVTAAMPYKRADVTGTAGSVLIPAKWLTAAVKTMKRDDHTATLTVNDGTVTLRTPNGSTETRTTLGEFPRWRPLLPTSEGYDLAKYWAEQDPTAPRAWNPQKMGALCKMANSLTRDDVTVTVTHHHPHKPWLLTTTNDGVEWTGLLMPARIPA